MNFRGSLAALPSLSVPSAPLGATWYRGVAVRFAGTPFATAHTPNVPSRFYNPAYPDDAGQRRYSTLYLAEDVTTAQFESRAVLGSPYGVSVSGPGAAVAVFPARVSVGGIRDLTDEVALRSHLAGTIQEITGNWLGYSLRPILSGSPRTSGLPLLDGTAPTQWLGYQAYLMEGCLGILSWSSIVPTKRILCLFMDKIAKVHGPSVQDHLGQPVT